jgi:N-acetylneuraminic acid mutarotase
MKPLYTLLAIITLISLSVTSSAQAPNTWTQKANFGGAARWYAVGFSIGAKGYIGTGIGMYNAYNDFWEYDTTTNVWTQKANVGGGIRCRAVGFSIGAKGYIGTGLTGNSLGSKDFWEYDTTTNTWTQKAKFGGLGRQYAVGFSIGTKGYIGTGTDTVSGSHFLNDFWEFDPSSDTWTQKTNFGGPGRILAVGFSIGTEGYIGTGVSDNSNYSEYYDNDFWEYDPSFDTWTQKANFGGGTRSDAVGFSIGTKGYISTGCTWLGGQYMSYYNDFWEYDPSLDTWTQKANFGGGIRLDAVGFSIGAKGYLGTGEDASGYRNDFWEYTPTCVLPNAPTNTTPLANQNICTGNSTTLNASGPGTLGWYSAATGGTWLGGGSTFTTPILASDTAYYVQDSTCGPSPTRTSIPVTVNPLPVPTITGQTSMCVNSGFYNYITEAGMTNYIWTVSSGGIIDYGFNTNQIQVSWIIAGPQTISVTYTTSAGCNPLMPTVLNITVNPLPGPAGTISGTANVCAGAIGVTYSVVPIPNTTVYVWALPPNATIASGAGTKSITVDFAANASSGDIFVWGNNICGDGQNSPPFSVFVTQLPAAAGNITGPDSVCQESTGKVYSVPPIYGATGYIWTLPAGAAAGNGSNSDSITVDYSTTAVSGNITVYGSNSCGDGSTSPTFAVIVNPIPPTPVISNTGDTLQSNASTGNQWYYEGTLITGATSQNYIATLSGHYWDVVDLHGCSSDTSNHKLIIVTGIDSHSSASIKIYPVPNDGQFDISINTASEEKFIISVYNTLGVKIYEEVDVDVPGSIIKVIDLRPVPNGVYTVVIENSQNQVVKKIVVYK